jgi:hypothetical protein
MTPKEKAKELVYGFIDLKLIPPSKAKQCALICVDEILKEYWLHDTTRETFWIRVKQQIELL